MKVFTSIVLVLLSSKSFALDKVEYFKATKESVEEMLRAGQLEEKPERILRMSLLQWGIELRCFDTLFEDIGPECIAPECEDPLRCPKTGLIGPALRYGGSAIAGHYGGKVVAAICDSAERRIMDWHERSERANRERVNRDRRENERNERCATAASGSGLGFGCSH